MKNAEPSSCLLQFDIEWRKEKGNSLKGKTLSDRGKHRSSNSLFFCPDSDLGCDTALARERHLDQSSHPATRDGLTEELQGVCAVVESNISPLQGLEGKGSDQLLRGIWKVVSNLIFNQLERK